jgi:hypothetical protein
MTEHIMNPLTGETPENCVICDKVREKDPDGASMPGDKCITCFMIEQANAVDALMCHCNGCGALVMMKCNVKTDEFIEKFKEENGEWKCLEQDTCIECDPKFEQERKDRAEKWERDKVENEEQYRETLRLNAPGNVGLKRRGLKSLEDAVKKSSDS